MTDNNSAAATTSREARQQPDQLNAPRPFKPYTVVDESQFAVRALLVGVNGVAGASCDSDANVRKMISALNKIEYPVQQMCVLSDVPFAKKSAEPTRAHILNHINWLMNAAMPGDSLFFYFSGRGGAGNTAHICTSDNEMITGDELSAMLVQPLPRGVRLTLVFDCENGSNLLNLSHTVGAAAESDGAVSYADEFAEVVCFAYGGGNGLLTSSLCTVLEANDELSYRGLVEAVQKQDPDAHGVCLLTTNALKLNDLDLFTLFSES